MSQVTNVAPSRALAWEAERLRVTVFLGPSASMPSADEWRAVAGEPPERKVELPKVGTVESQGPFASGSLVFRATPGRLDWNYTVRVAPDAPAPLPSTMGPYAQCLAEFIPRVQQWLTKCDHVQRLAYGAILHLPTKTGEEANHLLDEMLPSVDVDPASEDLKYRVNRPRRSTKVGFELRINRLATWSVAATEWVQFMLAGDHMRAQRENRTHACLLELDINTDAGRSEDLPQRVLSPLLAELVALGGEIAEKGDTP